ncbi:MAG: dihydroorotate dehydrogenase electron transfer subunit [Thermoplasmata archaeon]
MDIVTVSRIINETKNIKTILFNWDATPEPGQFAMVWMPHVDEIPMSISYSGKEVGFTVEAVGDATKALHALKPGDRIGIKGPLGNGFKLEGNDILAVGGGSGTAALTLAAESAIAKGSAVRIALGARTSDCLLFCDRFRKLGIDVHISTDDGTEGHRGFATELAGKLIAERRPDQIIACGPEPMMVTMLGIAARENIPIQCSLERYMKCGIGLCGSCQCGKYTVCGDGPVFDGHALSEISDFGKWKRDAGGKKLRL